MNDKLSISQAIKAEALRLGFYVSALRLHILWESGKAVC